MVIVEKIQIHGVTYNRTYSDKNFMIERDGIKYNEAIDPIEFNDRIYTETNEKIEINTEE